MKVRAVTPLSVAFADPNDGGHQRHLTFCRVEGDDGTVGWGEAITMWPEACAATERLIEGMAELVVGRDPLDNLDLWRRLRERAWWYGPQGIAAFALSAIDIALWDLRGKASGQSLLQMLGGAHHPTLPAVASTHAFDASVEREIERHARYIGAGYRGIKVGVGKRGDSSLGHDLEAEVQFLRGLREAVGEGPWLMIDRDHALPWDLPRVLELIRRLEPRTLHWIEEPFEPGAAEARRRLRAQTGVPVGGGEREWNEAGFRRLIEEGTLDVIGIDPGRSEGITGFLRVLPHVEAAGLVVNAHAFSSAVITAASIALSLSSPCARSLEYKPEPNPMQTELVAEPLLPRSGEVVPLGGPGLGIEVREDVLEHYRVR